MYRLIILILALTVANMPFATSDAQTKKKTTTTAVAKKKPVRKASTAAKGGKRTAAKGGKKRTAKGKQKTTYTNASIRGLQNQRAAVQKQIREQEKKLRANKADVKKRLDDLMTINGEIDQHQKTIDGIQKDITHIEGNISMLKAQLSTLEQQLDDRKAKYIKSMRYLARTRTIQDKLMFIFSANSLTQMYRRLRFVREYAAYQRAQGEMVKSKQNQITNKHKQLETVKGEKNTMLYKGQQEKTALQGKQTEQQQMVNSLQKQQKTIQAIINEQRKKDAALNSQIDRLIAEEVAKAKARAEAEARRKAAAAAEAKRKREAEVAKANEESRVDASVSSADRALNHNFESNRGRLPMPASGRIITHYGQYNVEGLSNVRLDSKGINIKCGAGAGVRSIFNGEVSKIFTVMGVKGVMIRHGQYISVYCNLSSVNVHVGQSVSTGQSIGAVDGNGVLQFQLHKGFTKLNPEAWLR